MFRNLMTVAGSAAVAAGLALSAWAAAPAHTTATGYRNAALTAFNGREPVAMHGLAPASCPQGANWYYLDDNYGGNSEGYLTDPGHTYVAITIGITSCGNDDLWGFFPVSGSPGWYQMCDPNNLCLEEAGTHHYIYMESGPVPAPTPEQFFPRFQCGTGIETFENRHFGDYALAITFSLGSLVEGHTIPSGGNGQSCWYQITS